MASVALLLCCLSATANEGFWQTAQQTELATHLANNHANTKADIINKLTQLSLATAVKVNNCSGALVAKHGLVLTSNNCIADKIAQSAALSVEGLVANDNFAAIDANKELPLQGVKITIPQQVDDVTLVIKRQLDSQLTPQQRLIKLQQLTEPLLQQCELQTKLRCQLHTVDGGLQYKIVKSLEIQDVRLVYAPNAALAQLGQKADANAWPQYSADYVFLRGYVDLKGQTADFSLQNVPHQAESFLAFSTQGVSEHDDVLVAGFPMYSQRYQTAAAVSLQFEQLEPLQLQYHQQALGIIQKHTTSNSRLAETYQHQLYWLAKIITQEQKQLARFGHSSVIKNKLSQEAKLATWINGSLVRRQLYTQVVQRVTELNQQQYQQSRRDLTLENFNYVQLPSLAQQLYHYALLRQDQTSNSTALKQAKHELTQSMQHIAEHFDSRVDQSLALQFLAEYAKLPPEHRLADLDHYFALKDGFNVEIVRHKLEAIYRGSKLSDKAQREAWLTANVEQFVQSQDTLISFAVAMQKSHEKIQQQRQLLEAELAQAWPAYIEVWQAFNDANNLDFYADANGTLRLNVAQVKGYQPRDAVWYQPFSSAKGLIDNFGRTEAAPAVNKLMQQLQQTEYQSLPINFLTNADITSGHAGAVTLNWQGNIVGIVIDGACETVISDWHYDEQHSRAIHVDSRYILWQLQQDKAAKTLLTELSRAN
ncbi:hypothetical protein BI198_13470 [Rheinheimera salexigens]|uniref:Dipeptidyl-peptidase n=2 Tax=Rheinheimera salexigens TaxID=1628148 RepID=A0A1E7Q8S6_9GAMM|nr:hypothetical protein BI198_13470 [Rheinheimera salexigens]